VCIEQGCALWGCSVNHSICPKLPGMCLQHKQKPSESAGLLKTTLPKILQFPCLCPHHHNTECPFLWKLITRPWVPAPNHSPPISVPLVGLNTNGATDNNINHSNVTLVETAWGAIAVAVFIHLWCFWRSYCPNWRTNGQKGDGHIEELHGQASEDWGGLIAWDDI
jgi:hypothetical protein